MYGGYRGIIRALGITALILTIVIVGLTLYGEYQSSLLLASIPKCYTLPANELLTKTSIKHVIIIFLENHSFDNIFGVYPSNGSISNPLITRLSVPMNLLTMNGSYNFLKPVPIDVFTTRDPNEGYVPYHEDWDYGRMDGWSKGSGPQSLYYFTVDQVSPLWVLAEEYGIADNYFTPVLSESAPNHLYLYAAFSPVIDDYGPPPYIPIQESIFAELCEYHVSWGYYVNPKEPHELLSIKYFYGIKEYMDHVQSWGDFINEVMNGSLPAVAFVLPDPTTDMGPPASVLTGEEWLLYIINAVMNSPIWNSTVIFITWDEFGGYYDHVAPPIINGEPLGVRVPLIVISPFAKEDYVSHTLLTHASIIAFIDYNWGLPALNYYVASSNVPLDFFYFNYTRPPISLRGFPIPGSIYPPYNINVTVSNLVRLYPAEPQIPLDQLPYSRYGSSNITLLQLNSTVYVRHNWAYTPIIYTQGYLWLVMSLIMVLLVMASLYLNAPRDSQAGSLPIKALVVIVASITTSIIVGLVTLTVGFINYIGNVAESLPLILGYFIGLLVFSIVGLVLIRLGNAWAPLIISLLTPLILYVVFYEQAVVNYLMNDSFFLIYGVLSAAPLIITMYLLLRVYVIRGSWAVGLMYSIVSGLLSFLIIIVVAREYIALYQPGLSTLLLPIELVDLVLAAMLVLIARTRVRVGGYGG
ncbi:alkaline phosphatase family protein [Vulcanisaeta thermophila]|uniref:alkaline phosphatase family protein n=1 Tax=Vulcanisaeta thermophila TaxID=867917 RepID=UPI000853EA31|nr:alkaline phosphatase family protein [Vulcanisaeta thermophila]